MKLLVLKKNPYSDEMLPPKNPSKRSVAQMGIGKCAGAEVN